MRYPKDGELEIDSANPHKLGRKAGKFVRWYWFMRNGFWSSSYWKWLRLLCWINSHQWASYYDMSISKSANIEPLYLDITLRCNRCWFTHKFSLRDNNLYYYLAGLVEVKTQAELNWDKHGYEKSNNELNRIKNNTKANLIKQFKEAVIKLEERMND